MCLDINSALRSFTYITGVYKCISNYHLKGHEFGRKVKDILEILTMGALYENNRRINCLSTEEKPESYTTAGHKIAFGGFHNIKGRRPLFGAIECKCVGVEGTTSGKNNKHLRRLSGGQNFFIDICGRWKIKKSNLH